VIFRQSPYGRYYSPIDDGCISQANDGGLLVAHRAISLLSLRVVWSLTGNPPCDHVRVRHCCVPPQPAPTFAEGRRQDAGHKVQLVQRCIVVFCDGACPVSDVLRSVL